jgi:hypothetical protein
VLDASGNYGAALPSTCRLVHKTSGGKTVKTSGRAGTDFREATFASDFKIALADCKAACDMMNADDTMCHAIQYNSAANTCQLITNVNVAAMTPCDDCVHLRVPGWVLRRRDRRAQVHRVKARVWHEVGGRAGMRHPARRQRRPCLLPWR